MPFHRYVILTLFLVTTLLTGISQSAEFCVHSHAEFTHALSAATTNGEDDVIRIAAGAPIAAFSYHPEIGTRLTIQSGFNQTCSEVILVPQAKRTTESLVQDIPAASLTDLKSTTGPVPPPEAGPKSALVGGETLSGGAEVVILGVPGYLWRHGCGPTALGMVIGYYDETGFSDLIDGDASTQTDAVSQAIASQRSAENPGHYEDYSLPMDSTSNPSPLDDKSEPPTGDEHPHDSIADFMKTSWSAEGMYYGWSWFHLVGPAYAQYVNLKNADYTVETTNHYFSSTLTWEVLTGEIDHGRPMVFLVDSNGDGTSDHFVTVTGYNDATMEYACLDTWNPAETIRWCRFRGASNQYSWGVIAGLAFSIHPVAIAFADVYLEAAVREAIGKPTGSIYPTDLIDLDTLHAENAMIASLEGIQACTNLSALYLAGNRINDLTPLAALTALTTLDVSGNQIVDLLPLSNLPNLSNLDAGDNQVSDITPLVSNPAIGQDDAIHLGSNPLSCRSLLGYIPQLLTRQATVYWTADGITDHDGDGLADADEDRNGDGMVSGDETDPCLADSDGDNIDDGAEMSFWGSNSGLDGDGDGLPNLLDPDADNDGHLDGDEINAGSNPADRLSYPAATTIAIHKGFNLVSIPADVTAKPKLTDWLATLGDATEIDHVMVYDRQTGHLLKFIPDTTTQPDFTLSGGEALIVSAKINKSVAFQSVKCGPYDLASGINYLGFACSPAGLTAFDLLSLIGPGSAISIQRYNTAQGRMETAGFNGDGNPVGIDFAIVPGEGYSLTLSRDYPGLTIQ